MDPVDDRSDEVLSSPLAVAIFDHDVARVRRLLEIGHRPVLVTSSEHPLDRGSELHEAVERRDAEIVALLLRYGCGECLNGLDYAGRTPLSIAQAHGDLELVRALLAAGARKT